MGAKKPGSKQRRLLRWLVAIPSSVVLAYVVAAVLLWNWGTRDRAVPSEAIVVFGARVEPGGGAGRPLRDRTRHAFLLWKQGLAPLIVCTGGVGDNPPAESLVEQKLLLSWGVPQSAILTEQRSRTTRQNAQFAAAALEARLGAKSKLNVIAVSDAYHLWRARRDCAKFGLVAHTSPTTADSPTASLKTQWVMALREVLSVTRDLMLDLFPRFGSKD